MKAEHISIALRLEDVPSLNSEIAARLRDIGVHHPRDLATLDPLSTYDKLCQITRQSIEITWLDRLLAAVAFASGSAPRAWPEFASQRQRLLGERKWEKR